MADKDDPKQEGHTKEWQDRARVVLDAKKAVQTEASPKQSPELNRNEEKVNRDGEKRREETDDKSAY